MFNVLSGLLKLLSTEPSCLSSGSQTTLPSAFAHFLFAQCNLKLCFQESRSDLTCVHPQSSLGAFCFPFAFCLPNALPLQFCFFLHALEPNPIFQPHHWLHFTYHTKCKLPASHSHLPNIPSSPFTPSAPSQAPNQLLSFAHSCGSLTFHPCIKSALSYVPDHTPLCLCREITLVRPFKQTHQQIVENSFQSKLWLPDSPDLACVGCNTHCPAQLMRALKQRL